LEGTTDSDEMFHLALTYEHIVRPAVSLNPAHTSNGSQALKPPVRRR
jgi:hypothetical protein